MHALPEHERRRPLLLRWSVAGCAAWLLLAPAVARAGDDDVPAVDDLPHITVVGKAATVVVPDTAVIRLGVNTVRPTATDAWQADANAAKAVIDAAKAAGVKPQAIGTSRLSLFQEFDSVRQPDGTVKREAHGFRASQGLNVRLTDFSKIGSLTGALIAAGADAFDGIEFSVGDADAVRDHLRSDAVRNARRQAEAMAAAGGVKIGRLLKIEPPDHASAVRPQVRSFYAAGPATMPVEPGTETLTAEVEVTYAIE